MKRGLSLIALALIVAFGYSATSNAIQFAQSNEEPAETEEAAPAEGEAAEGEAMEIDEARVVAGLEVYKSGGCRGCHGWAADGVREGPNPQGPSLRATPLDYDALHLTVACGRPGTEMPYFWREAYRRDSTECYGMTAADFGNLLPIRATNRFTTEQIDDLAYYLAYYVKGQGEITRAQCEFYYGEGATRCESYPAE
ncbi:MAG: c-type cytochrome [Bauldia sp.]|nr:c-type cytochrome [Bauldia sp.]